MILCNKRCIDIQLGPSYDMCYGVRSGAHSEDGVVGILVGTEGSKLGRWG